VRPLDQSFLAEQVRSAQRRLRQVEAERRRLVDAYQSGLITAEEFEDRAPKLAERIKSLEADRKRLEEEEQQSCGAKDLLGRIEEFTSKVTDKLGRMSFGERQALARMVLDEVVLDGHEVHIYFKLPLPKRTTDDSNNRSGDAKRKARFRCGIALESNRFRQTGQQTVRHGRHQACCGCTASTDLTPRSRVASRASRREASDRRWRARVLVAGVGLMALVAVVSLKSAASRRDYPNARAWRETPSS